MIAFFGTLNQAKAWSKETSIPLKEIAIAEVQPERLQGLTEPITVHFEEDFQPTQATFELVQIIRQFNLQFLSTEEAPNA